MEQRAYQKWTRGLLLGLVLVLMACAAVVYRVDPCFYYRMPTDREPVFFSERYQTAGIVRNNPARMETTQRFLTGSRSGIPTRHLSAAARSSLQKFLQGSKTVTAR